MLLKNTIFGVLLLCVMVGQAQFLHLYGNEENNTIHRVKVFDRALYTLEYMDSEDKQVSIFSKYDLNGIVVWRISFGVGTSLNDFATDGNGVFMLVGRTLPSERSFDNESILAHVVDEGRDYRLSCIGYYDQGNREGFNKIQYRATQGDFLILGVDVEGSSIRDNVYLLTADKDCGILSNAQYGLKNSRDSQFYNDLIPMPNDEWMLVGNDGGSGKGIHLVLNSDLTVKEAYEISSFSEGRVSAINSGIQDNENTIVVGRIPALIGEVTSGLIAEIGSNGKANWALRIEESTTLYQIIGPITNEQNGRSTNDYYVMGRAMFDGIERPVVYKFRSAINIINPSHPLELISTIYLTDGESSFVGGWLDTYETDLETRIIYADGREGNINGFGGVDALLGNLDLDLTSSISKSIEHYANDAKLKFNRTIINRRDVDIPPFAPILLDTIIEVSPFPYYPFPCPPICPPISSCPRFRQALSIWDYPYQNNLLREICAGDLAHFRFVQGLGLPFSGDFTHQYTKWYYNDGVGEIELSESPFTICGSDIPLNQSVGCAFSTYIDYDCSNSTTGFIDRTYTIETVYTTPSSLFPCENRSSRNLRICCPIGEADIELTPDHLCAEEDGEIAINISLNSPDLFVQIPGEYVDIVWFLDDSPLGEEYLDWKNFTYDIPISADISSPQQICFKAVITNCNDKERIVEKCIMIDPEPRCGGIIAWPEENPMNLTLISDSPNPIYTICPNNDATIGIDPTNGFENCTPQWQYTFDLDNPNWIDMGFSNNIQNTNVLPTAQWTGDAIYYRIKCVPLSNPSGCEPCYSDTLTIRLQDIPSRTYISGTSKVCKGEIISLSTVSSDDELSHTWFCNGAIVGTGTNIELVAEQSACYWVESTDTNGCYIVESKQYCVEVCEIAPILSCPILPNDCACLGKKISLSACESFSTCSDANLEFAWYINGVLQQEDSCTLTHLPPTAGAIYKVVITDTINGCTASTEQIVLPCDKGKSEKND